MAESFISKRVEFPEGKQKEFLDKIMEKMSIEEIAKICDLSERTMRDWRREKFSMSLEAVKILSRITNRKIPQNVKIKEPFWYAYKGAKIGGIACLEKYGVIGGDPEYRKRKWREWWEKDGRHRKKWLTIAKPIREPPYSERLAEFVGIVLGDGCISDRQIAITLHHIDDKVYGKYVISLVKKLFNVPVGVYHCEKDSVIDLVVSRSKLVRYCTERLGLKIGSKVRQQVDIPAWIKRNKKYSIACVRGLIDTDGCVFRHKYRVNGKLYAYNKLSFSNRSRPILQSVFNFLKMLHMSPRITKDEKDVRLESKQDLRFYFSIINSRNPKILGKIRKLR
ncbi:MAG: LAGLIDADG family homing endonuclease [Candidatus Wildermuthbacteria bacterium]|nr:LAGLIDADG family homing endonuclease [Candidatus Wildermuthbacteria bacterium]